MVTQGNELRWGRPPLALVPAALAGRLADVPLPPWATDLLDGPGAAVADLGADAWERLPLDDALWRRLRREVAERVRVVSFELRDVPVGFVEVRADCWAADGTHGPVVPDPDQWRARARAALRGAVWRPNAGWCTVTFGDLLDQPRAGITTALEVAALLELGGAHTGRLVDRVGRGVHPPVPHHGAADPCAAAPGDGPTGPAPWGDPAIPVRRWGAPGCALLPRSIRHALAREPLPGWVRRALGLPAGATALDLDETVWRRAGGVPDGVRAYLLRLLDRRAVRTLQVMDEPWPTGLRPEHVPWPRRLRHALSCADLLDPERLERCTFADLLGLRSVGRKSALEFGVIADALPSARQAAVGEADRRALADAAREEWTERIGAGDRRFTGVLPDYGATLRVMLREAARRPGSPLAGALAATLPAVRARAEELAAEPIDLVVPRLAGAVGVPERDLAMTADRLGWHDGRRRTFREVASRHSLSRERARQVVERTIGRVAAAYLPQVRRAADLLAARAPVSAGDAARLLVAEGFAVAPLDPAALQALAEAMGYETGFRVEDAGGGRLVLASGSGDARAVLGTARRLTQRYGVASVEQVEAALASRGRGGPPDAGGRAAMHAVLRAAPGVAFLDTRWLWFPDAADRDPLRAAVRQMLAAVPRIDLRALRGGVARNRRLTLHQVAPVEVLAAYFRTHPDFVLVGSDVTAASPLDYRQVLEPCTQAFVEALRAAPRGRVRRSALQAAAIARGVPRERFATCIIGSAILSNEGYDSWCLRGANGDGGGDTGGGGDADGGGGGVTGPR